MTTKRRIISKITAFFCTVILVVIQPIINISTPTYAFSGDDYNVMCSNYFDFFNQMFNLNSEEIHRIMVNNGYQKWEYKYNKNQIYFKKCKIIEHDLYVR